jgi:hypothetical protein
VDSGARLEFNECIVGSGGVRIRSNGGSPSIGTATRGRRSQFRLDAIEVLWARKPVVFVVAVALQSAIALPFIWADPAETRGVPGPSLLAVAMGGAFLLGPVGGLALGAISVIYGTTLLPANPWLTAPLWCGLSVLSGVVGLHLQRLTAERAALHDELQAGLFPTGWATHAELVTAGRYLPAEEQLLLAGDFYGITDTPDGGVAALVGDVSGHGARAAGIGSHLRSTWLALIRAGVDPRTLIRVLNETMNAERRRRSDELFATVCCTWVSPDAARASVVVAGHPPAILLDGREAQALALDHGPPLGVVDHMPWHVQEIALPPPPWTLFLYSDGLIEGRAEPHSGERFGIERLSRLLAGRRSPLGDADFDDLLRAVSGANGGQVGDDVVLLSVSRPA